MDDSLKDVLTRHWQVLVRYINPTTNLISVLVEDKVLPSAMIEDIKKGTNRKEKSEILLKSIKLRGNTSYRKFREAMLKCGQMFIADLLYEEETSKFALIEESDIASLPSLKLSLTQDEMKQLVLTLDAKARGRALKNEWRKDSQRRIDILQTRADDYKTEKNIQVAMTEYEQQIKQLTTELNVKNDIIRSLSLDINVLNQEVLNFTQKHQQKSSPRPITPLSLGSPRSTGNDMGTMNTSRQTSNRFRFFENALSTINHRLNLILADSSSDHEEEVAGVDMIGEKTVQVQQLVKDLEAKVMQIQRDREEAVQLLLPGRKISGMAMVQAVQRFMMQDQKYRYSLLKDIDRLSRKLRGINYSKSSSGLFALKQSAVTGKPSPDMIDFRFLSNHISLLETDADHLYKKLEWKDSDIKSLKAEIAGLRKRYSCPREPAQSRDTDQTSDEQTQDRT